MLSEAKNLWYLDSENRSRIDPRFFASLRTTLIGVLLDSAPIAMRRLVWPCQRVLDKALHNAAQTRPTKNCGPSRVSSALSKGAGRERFHAHVSSHPRKRRLNIRNTENHNRCPLSDRNLR